MFYISRIARTPIATPYKLRQISTCRILTKEDGDPKNVPDEGEQADKKQQPLSDVQTKNENREGKSDAEAAAQSLKNLLDTMSSPEKGVQATIAGKIKKEIRPIEKIKLGKVADEHAKKLLTAVKDVADELGGDVKQTEQELLHVIMNNQATGIKKSVDLVSMLNSMNVEAKKTDIKVEEKREFEKSLPKYLERSPPSRKKKLRTSTSATSSSILSYNERLNIFRLDYKPKGDTVKLSLWEKLEIKEIEKATVIPPRNVYDEMIQWTNQGRLWHFPIDNEQGLKEEKTVDFTEHVFLDKHLHPWCPPVGPIRHFMELVLVGLSKNPYITVKAKVEHIHWFKDYFEEKRKLLTEVGAYGEQEVTQKHSGLVSDQKSDT